MQQQQESFFQSAYGWAVVSSRGGKNHVTRVKGTWYGALEASAICGTKPRAQYSQHHGWVVFDRQFSTVPEAAQAAGGTLCSKCLQKAEQAAARERLAAQAEQEAAEQAAAEAEALAYSPELQELMQQQAAAQEAEQALAASCGFTPAGWEALAWQDRQDFRDRAAARERLAAQAAAAVVAEPARLTLAKTPADLPAVVETASLQAEEAEQPAEALPWLPERDRQTPTPNAPALARALMAEALTDYPSCQLFAITAHVYLEDRGYAVVRTIQRNIRRQALLQAFSALVGQQQLSKLVAFPDLCG